MAMLGGPTDNEAATAFDFTKLFLATILRPDDKPIVFFHEKEMPRWTLSNRRWITMRSL